MPPSPAPPSAYQAPCAAPFIPPTICQPIQNQPGPCSAEPERTAPRSEYHTARPREPAAEPRGQRRRSQGGRKRGAGHSIRKQRGFRRRKRVKQHFEASQFHDSWISRGSRVRGRSCPRGGRKGSAPSGARGSRRGEGAQRHRPAVRRPLSQPRRNCRVTDGRQRKSQLIGLADEQAERSVD